MTDIKYLDCVKIVNDKILLIKILFSIGCFMCVELINQGRITDAFVAHISDWLPNHVNNYNKRAFAICLLCIIIYFFSKWIVNLVGGGILFIIKTRTKLV